MPLHEQHLTNAVSRALSSRLSSPGQSDGLDVLEWLNRQGITPLVHWCQPDLDEMLKLEPNLREHWLEAAPNIQRAAQDYAGQSLAWRVEWQQALNLLAGAGIEVLILKGASLADLIYPDWSLRMLGDLDILVPPDDVDRALEVLTSVGYQAAVSLPGDLVFSEQQLQKRLFKGLNSTIDLHWALSNRSFLGNRFSWTELADDAQALNTLPAKGLSFIHALLHACIHRSGHHRDFERIIWLMDIHLLWCRGDDRFHTQAIDTAIERRLAALLLDALAATRATLGTPLNNGQIQQLEAAGKNEPGRIYLGSGDTALQDLAVLPDWSSRWRYLRQQMFPIPSYMRQRYPGRSPLAWLYLRRLGTATLKRFGSALRFRR